ncbi:GNAT family N-acetyltransferase [Kineosporia sp. J2-2]|uniref:GNAT family N-acetyltransferase n=1 Tax=Kineosporia corallincola TaxID=2835133 RepID=A0ABS5THZ5_9ACTN|nr:GNAT family N-acetyltransferase [Kineosporia corallincola]MBT0770715.1 GNAT family N-acetyltransferase [Kineosporia corallincola]
MSTVADLMGPDGSAKTLHSQPKRQALTVVRLRASDWGVLKMVRLRALRESPKAFATGYQTECRVPRSVWQSRLTAATWLIARTGPDHEIVGVACLTGPDEPGEQNLVDAGRTRYVEAVWVAPDARRQGVVRRLLSSLEAEARHQHIDELMLWVLEHNRIAWEAYRHLGFVPTGEEQPLRVAPGRWVQERCMRKQLV